MGKLWAFSETLRVAAFLRVRRFVPDFVSFGNGGFSEYYSTNVRSECATLGVLSMKMSIRDLGKFLAAVVALAYGQTAFGQTTDNQVFTVTVPSLLSITAPANKTIDTTTDQTDGNKVFTPGGAVDHWAVTCNSSSGATVALTALTPFVNGTSQRDAQLDLAIGSGGTNWAVSVASDVTDYGGGTNTATVQAASTAPGDGGLALTVTFINTTYSDLTEGDYVMTVQGTISANP